MFDSDDNSIRNNVEWFLMGDFLWFSPWSGSLGENLNTHVCVYKYIYQWEFVKLCLILKSEERRRENASKEKKPQ